MWFSNNQADTVYCDRNSDNASAILADLDLRFVGFPEEADLVWMRKGYIRQFGNLKEYQLLNHVPGERAMTNKGHLTRHLKKPDQEPPDGISLDEFYPETYCLYMGGDRDAFFAQLPPQDVRDNLWILKPAYLSRGEGIHILWQFDQLKSDLQNPDQNLSILEPGGKYVIQKYIQNPFLLQGFKSEIRIYWLIACLDPLLVLVYKEGTTRLTTQPFQLEEFDNPLVHIANSYQQKQHPDYESFRLKWSFSELESYITLELKLADPGFIEDQLKAQIKKILRYVVHSAINTLTRKPPQGLFFGLFGADLILDDTLRPWLTEVQKGPGLSHSDPVKKQVIPPMLQEAARIVLEVQQRKRKGASLAKLDSVDGYEWMINMA